MRYLNVFAALLAINAICFGLNYGGGDGSLQNPFVILTADQLNQIGLNTADWDKHFLLASDIDLSEFSADQFNIIGEVSTPFTGSFNGQGYCIYKFTFSTTAKVSYAALFGAISFANISNLSLLEANISTEGDYVAGLCGYSYMSNFSDCYIDGDINGGLNSNNIGGLVGYAEGGTITGCKCSVYVSAGNSSSNIGGLFGYGSSSVSNCFTSGKVSGGTGARAAGGLVGKFDSQTGGNTFIEESFSICDVEIGSIEAGGLVGYQNLPVIRNCFSAGDVTAAGNVGGLVGFSRMEGALITSITGCYSTGNVSISSVNVYAGGLVGYSESGFITDCYSTSNVTGGSSVSNAGGFVGGQIAGGIERCYSKGSVTVGTDARDIGGFAGGLMSTNASQCFSSGNVSTLNSAMRVGGFAGSLNFGNVINCYSFSDAVCDATSYYVGGLIGNISETTASVQKSFSTGLVVATNIKGGLIGYMTTAVIDNCFWDTQTSGLDTSSGGKGKTTAQMQNPDTFTFAGWDFIDETLNGTKDIWHMRGYPALYYQPAIDLKGDTVAAVAFGGKAEILLEITNLLAEPIEWAIITDQADWIESIIPMSGSFAAAGEKTVLNIGLDAEGMNFGYYCSEISINTNSTDLKIPIVLKIFEGVSMVEFGGLAQYWGIQPCDFGQSCKAFDWYIDGSIESKDLLQLALYWLDEDVEEVKPTIFDGFETGDFSNLDWIGGGNQNWIITSSYVYDGSFAARSGNISHSQMSILELSTDTAGWQVDTVAFTYQVSTESGYDVLRFYINDAQQLNVSGNSGWVTVNYSITAGVNTFKWIYSKDSSDSAGMDCVFIDNFKVYAK